MSVLTGWCITGDCDTELGRGGCPVLAGGNPACGCSCHQGSAVARPLLAERCIPSWSAGPVPADAAA